MNTFAAKLRRFLVSEDGPTAIEYAVMLSLIVVVCLAAIQSIGTKGQCRVQQRRQLDLMPGVGKHRTTQGAGRYRAGNWTGPGIGWSNHLPSDCPPIPDLSRSLEGKGELAAR